MAFKQETKNIFMVKKYIDNCPKGGVLEKHKIISTVETAMDVMKRKKEISGRGYGILIRYLRKKIPKEEPFYDHYRRVRNDGSINISKRNQDETEENIEELLSNLVND